MSKLLRASLVVAGLGLFFDLWSGGVFARHSNNWAFFWITTIITVLLIIVMYILAVKGYMQRSKDKEQRVVSSVKELEQQLDEQGNPFSNTPYANNALPATPVSVQIGASQADDNSSQIELAAPLLSLSPDEMAPSYSLSVIHKHTERELQIIEEERTPLDPPPTPQEIHEAEMNPWPGHTMRETILRNRDILSSEPPSMPMLQQQVAVPANQEPQPPYVSQQQDDPTVSTDQSPPAPSREPPPTSYSEQLPPEQTQPEDHPAESDQQRYNSPRGDTTNEDPNN